MVVSPGLNVCYTSTKECFPKKQGCQWPPNFYVNLNNPSVQIRIFHQRRYPWNTGISLPQLPFGGPGNLTKSFKHFVRTIPMQLTSRKETSHLLLLLLSSSRPNHVPKWLKFIVMTNNQMARILNISRKHIDIYILPLPAITVLYIVSLLYKFQRHVQLEWPITCKTCP